MAEFNTQSKGPGQRDRPQRSRMQPRRGRRPGESNTEMLGADGLPGPELVEKVVFINRSAKVVKGGRRFSFSALMVVGDKQGRVGVGLGKANEVAEAIRKGGEIARNHMVRVSLKEDTIPHEVETHYCGAHVLLRPASTGTGVIAGKTVRAVLESAGVRNVLSKSLGSKNAANVVKATIAALQQMRLREDIYRSRGIAIKVPETPTASTEEAVVAPATPTAEPAPEPTPTEATAPAEAPEATPAPPASETNGSPQTNP